MSIYERPARLTQSEKQIMELLAEGQSCRDIASSKKLSEHTIRTHLKNIYRKLEVKSALQAVACYLRQQKSNNTTHEMHYN